MAKNGRLPTPFRDPKGRFFARRRVPKELRFHFKGEFVQKTLETRDPVEAAKRFPEVNAEIERAFENKRQLVQMWQLDDSDLPKCFDSLLGRWIEALDPLAPSMFGVFVNPEKARDWSPEYRTEFAQLIGKTVSEYLELGDLPPAVDDRFRKHIEMRLPTLFRRDKASDSRSSPAARLFTPESRAPDPIITLSGLFSEWSAARDPSKSAYDELKATIQDFVSVYGNIPASEVTKADLSDFRDRLLKQPRSMERRCRSLPLEDRARLPGKRVSATTVGKKITLLKALLAYGYDEGFLTSNAGSRVYAGPKHKQGKRAQFLPDEISAIFKLQLFDPSSWGYDNTVSDVTLAWMMLIGLTSGPRLKEAGQVELADVVKTGSIMALRVTAESDEADAEEQNENEPPSDRKSTKTDDSERFLVIHPDVLALGFEKFVSALRRAGATKLFPDVWQRGAPSTHDASRFLNRWIDLVTTRRKVCFYSLRHTWIAAADNTDMKEKIQRQLQGHAPRDESEKYGEAYLPVLAENLAKVRFDMVDWQPLKKSWASIDWDQIARRLLQRYDGAYALAA